MPKKVMKEFRLDEISLVDQPAQEGALPALIKQQDRSPRRETKEESMNEPASFEMAVRKFREGGLSGTAALRKAHDDHPELLGPYQARTPPPSNKAAGNGDAIAKFRRLVGEIAKRDSCSATEAMRRAADEHPEELEAYRGA